MGTFLEGSALATSVLCGPPAVIGSIEESAARSHDRMADDKDNRADPIIGREWGNYVVECKIGEGGMGAVYRLVHKLLPNTVAALKVLSAEGAALASARERFEQEAMVAAEIGRERVAAVRDYGTFADGIPYIVMDLIEGQSLAALLRETGPLRVLDAFRIAYHVADTLVIAHGKNIIHRDIKPSNLMLSRTRSRDYSVTILDWGIAKARGELQVAHTGTAAVTGTLGYMAPETMAPKAAIDGRVDVFSLGVTLFEMLAGQKPYMIIASAEQIADAIDFYRNHPVSIARSRPPALDPVPRWLERIVLRALMLDQTDRPTMDKFRKDLTDAIDELQKNPENRPPPSRHEEPDATTSGEVSIPGPAVPGKTDGDGEAETNRQPPTPADSRTRKLSEPPTTAMVPRTRVKAPPVLLAVLGIGLVILMLFVGTKHQAAPRQTSDMSPPLEDSALSHRDLGLPLVSDSVGKPPIPVPPDPEPSRITASQPARAKAPPAVDRGTHPSTPSPKKCKRNSSGALICP